jgi:hypothetical protein
VGLFRKRSESYNEQMLREAGLLDYLRDQPPQPLAEPTLLAKAGLPDGAGVGPREWDAAVTVTAPGLTGSRIEFTSLPGGDLLVDDEDGAGDLSPLADCVEQDVQPPYKALAVRQDGDLWAVAAKRIELVRIDFPHAGSLELSRKDSWTDLRVDGEPSDAQIPQLEGLGEAQGRDFFVKAERLDGELWEVRVSVL